MNEATLTQSTKGKKHKKITLNDINKEIERYQKMKFNFHQKNFIELRTLLENYISDESDDNSNPSILSKEDKEEFKKFLISCDTLSEFNLSLRKPLYLTLSNFCFIKQGQFSDAIIHLFYKKSISDSSHIEAVRDSIMDKIVPFILSRKQFDLSQNIIRALAKFLSLSSFTTMNQRLVSEFRNLIVKKEKDTVNNNLYYKAILYYLKKAKHYSTILITKDFLNKFFELIHYYLSLKTINNNQMDVLMYLVKIGINVYSLKRKELNVIEISNYTDILLTLYSSYNKTRELFEDTLYIKLKDFYQKISNNKVDYKESSMTKSNLCLLSNQLIFYCSYISLLNTISINDEILVLSFQLINSNYLNHPIIIKGICNSICKVLKSESLQKSKDFNEFIKQISQVKLINYISGDSYLNCAKIANVYGDDTMMKERAKKLTEIKSKMIINMIYSILHIFKISINILQSNKEIEENNKAIILLNLNELSTIRTTISLISLEQNLQYKENLKKIITPSFNKKIKKIINDSLYCLYHLNITKCNLEDLKPIFEVKINRKDSHSYLLYLIYQQIITKKKDNSSLKSFYKSIYIQAFDIIDKEIQAKEPNENLIVSIIYYILTAVDLFNTKDSQEDKDNYFKIELYLKNEDKNCLQIPLFIERIGCNINNLLGCFKGDNKVNPYSPISFRLLSQIINVITNSSNEISFDNQAIINDKNNIIRIKKEIINENINMINKEKEIFKVLKIKFNNESKKNCSLTKQWKNYIHLFPTLINFLMLKGDKNESQIENKYDNYLKNSNSPFTELELKNNNKHTFSLNKIESIIPNSDETIYESILKKLKEQPFQKQIDNCFSISEIFSSSVKYLNVDNSDIQTPFSYGISYENSIRQKEQETVNNIHMRCLIISSFLRGLFHMLTNSSFEYSSQLKKVILESNNLRDICLLVDCTKMKELNIAYKFLQVIHELIDNIDIYEEDEGIELFKEHYELIIYMLCKIITIYKKEFSIKDTSHLNLLLLISSIVSKLISISSSMSSILLETDAYKIIINFFIDALSIYMKTETDILMQELLSKSLSVNKKNKEFLFDKEILSISLLFGELMYENKQFEKYILEELTKANLYHGIKIRKTFLREILINRKYEEIKDKLTKKRQQNINFISKCITHTGNIQFLLIVNENEIRTLTYKNSLRTLMDENDEELNEWDIRKNSIKDLSEYEIENNIDKQTYIKIKISSINKIYTMEYPNRIIIQTSERKLIPLFFFRLTASLHFISLLTKYNSYIKKETLYLHNRDINDISVIGRVKEINHSFGSITQLTNSPNAIRIIKITKDEVKIYSENIELINKIKYTNTMKNYLTEEACYKLEDIKLLKFSKIDLILAGMNSCVIQFQLFDDISYMILRKKVLSVLILRGFSSNRLNKKPK